MSSVCLPGGLLIMLALSAHASEFEITADSFTVDKQVNLSSAAYFQGQASAPGAPAAATQLMSPGGLYFDGTYYKVWNSQTGAWVQIATGTVETGRVARAGDTMTGQLTTLSTITVQGNAFSVGGSTFVVSAGQVGISSVPTAGVGFSVGPSSFVVLQNGSAGIGTAAPNLPLTVKTGGSVYRNLNIGQNLVGTMSGLMIESNTQQAAIAIQHDDAGGFGFWTRPSAGNFSASDEKMVIASGGNVGIGTTSPGAKLSFGGLVGSPAIYLYDNGAGVRYGYGIQGSELQTFIPTSAHLSFNAGGDLQASGTNEVMRITGGGNVGIGTTAPTQGKLVVQGLQNSFPTIFVNDAGGNGQTGAVVDLEGNMASNPSLNRSLLLLRDTNPAGSDVGDSLLIRAFGTTTGGGGGTATTVFTVSRTGNVGIAANGGFCNVGGGNCVTVDSGNHLRPTFHNGMDLGDPTNTFSNLYVGNGIYLNGVAYTNPDYVFEPEYPLMPLDKLEIFTSTNKHLPHIPSTREVKEKGVEIFEQNRVVLENLEEAYRYIFQLNARLRKQQAEIDALRMELKERP